MDPTRMLQQLFMNNLGNLLISQVSDESDQFVKEATMGHLEAVKEILAKNPDMVNRKSSMKAALHKASAEGRLDVVQHLLTVGANVDVTNESDHTPVHYAAKNNRPEVLRVLMSSGANVNAQGDSRPTPLHVAVIEHHVACVVVLLEGGSDVNAQESQGDTPLHDAILNKDKRIIDILVNADGVDFTKKNHRGFNVLHHAVCLGNDFAVGRILQKCPEMVNTKMEEGFTALHIAATNDYQEMVTVLLSNGADVTVKCVNGMTPLMLAEGKGHVATAKLLKTGKNDSNDKQ